VILDGTKLGSITFQRQGGPAVKYNSTEIHFNGPSEHKQDGHRLDMEMQIVHHLEKGQEADAHDAIVSVLFKRDEQGHPLIDDLLTGKEVNLSTLIAGQPWFHYRGSHTAPPSIDFVKWFVLSRVLPVSARQMVSL
jgi:carbonic anhydrase